MRVEIGTWAESASDANTRELRLFGFYDMPITCWKKDDEKFDERQIQVMCWS